MACTRKKAETSPVEDTSFNPAEFDTGIQQPAEIKSELVESPVEQTAFKSNPSIHVDNPSRVRRESHVESSRRLPDKMTVSPITSE